jgi:hypothetical protein
MPLNVDPVAVTRGRAAQELIAEVHRDRDSRLLCRLDGLDLCALFDPGIPLFPHPLADAWQRLAGHERSALAAAAATDMIGRGLLAKLEGPSGTPRCLPSPGLAIVMMALTAPALIAEVDPAPHIILRRFFVLPGNLDFELGAVLEDPQDSRDAPPVSPRLATSWPVARNYSQSYSLHILADLAHYLTSGAVHPPKRGHAGAGRLEAHHLPHPSRRGSAGRTAPTGAVRSAIPPHLRSRPGRRG